MTSIVITDGWARSNDRALQPPTALMERLHRTAQASPLRLLLMAPPNASVPRDFENVYHTQTRHEELLGAMQRLRGRVYLHDGAIGKHQLSSDGRHRLDIDRDSWHLLAIDSSGAVCGCVRYRSHNRNASFHDLSVRHSAAAHCPVWGRAFRAAVEADLHEASLRGVSYVELGGWAIAPEFRCSTEALRTALATFSLARSLGGCIGITTATTRHSSSSILRRIGGGSLHDGRSVIPSYFDPQYNCEMEVLRFDSARPAEKYAPAVDRLHWDMLSTPVISPTRPRTFRSFGIFGSPLSNLVPVSSLALHAN